MGESDRYRQAGVDIEKGNQFVRLIAPLVASTHGPEVISDLGGFSGLVALDPKAFDEPVLVSSTDGVGTKLKLAFMLGKHDTVGIDLVGMCVNDIVVTGARPLFMLDYLSMGKLELETARQVVAGIVEGCRQAGCALIGGETAEMPGFYPPGEYDLAGFAVGVLERSQVIDGAAIRPGYQLLGLASSGLHSNGFSLVRKVVLQELKLDLAATPAGLARPLGLELLEPTRIYVKAVLAIKERFDLAGVAHITGGGILENVPRMLPEGCRARVRRTSWPVPPIFGFLQGHGRLSDREMLRTFNAGIGLVMALPPGQAEEAREHLAAMGQEAYLIGEVTGAGSEEPAVEVVE